MFDALVLDVAQAFSFAYEKEDWPANGLQSCLYGPDGLGSLELVAFLSMVEEFLERDKGIVWSISTEKAFSSQSSPFKTLATLAHFLEQTVHHA